MNINLSLLQTSVSPSRSLQADAVSSSKIPSGQSLNPSAEETQLPVYGSSFSGQQHRAKGKTPELEAILRELESFATYNHEQGGFFATRQRTYKNPVGSMLGYGGVDKYLTIGIVACGRKYYYEVHRLVWLWHTGSWACNKLDHIDRDKRNNKIENLRDVTHALNLRNQAKHVTNTSGYIGVVWNRSSRKWEACIRINGRRLYLGIFNTPEAAAAARNQAIINNPQWGYLIDTSVGVPQSTQPKERHNSILKITL